MTSGVAGAADRLAQARWVWAEVDLDALDHNVRLIRECVAPAEVWAVVKADGYGHGAVTVATQALASGATGLCVALAAEAVALRVAGIVAPILVLSEQPAAQLDELVSHGIASTVYRSAQLDALAAAVDRQSGVERATDRRPYPVHVKLDSGMQRVGADLGAAVQLVERITADGRFRLEGVFTHLACADVPDAAANDVQLDRFEEFLLAVAGLPLGHVHAANSAGALAIPRSRYDAVRAGIAIYGISPGEAVEAASALRPVLSLKARVSFVKRVAAGSHVSYGWRHEFGSATTVATVPIGYADGVPRRMGTLGGRSGAEVLVAGRRCPIVGVVTMDQLVVDIGHLDVDVDVGDEVVLIGEQGTQSISASEWADRLDTIGYEVVCAISGRVPRIVKPA